MNILYISKSLYHSSTSIYSFKPVWSELLSARISKIAPLMINHCLTYMCHSCLEYIMREITFIVLDTINGWNIMMECLWVEAALMQVWGENGGHRWMQVTQDRLDGVLRGRPTHSSWRKYGDWLIEPSQRPATSQNQSIRIYRESRI